MTAFPWKSLSFETEPSPVVHVISATGRFGPSGALLTVRSLIETGLLLTVTGAAAGRQAEAATNTEAKTMNQANRILAQDFTQKRNRGHF